MGRSRPAPGTYYTRAKVALDVQPYGPGYAREYLGCVMMDAIDAPARSLTRKEMPDPARAGEFIFAGNIPGEKGNATTTITLRRNRADALAGLRNCEFGLYMRYLCAGRPDDVENWESIDLLCRARITSVGRSGGPVFEGGENDEVQIPVSLEAGELVEFISRVMAERVQPALVADAINKVRYCSAPSCGECDDLPGDECSVWHAVTDAGAGGLYDVPILITYDERQVTGAQWRTRPIDAFATGEDAVDFVCIGDQLVVISPTGGFAYSPDGGDTWYAGTGVTIGANAPRALYASGREVWCSADNGYIYKSDDAGVTWRVEDAGTVTTEDLVAIAGYGNDTVIAVGATNAVARTRNGGRTWAAVTGPSAGDNLTAVALPRENHVYIGTDVGGLWWSRDAGDSWTEIALPTGGAGTIQAIEFCGACGGGEFGWLVWNKVHLAVQVGTVFRSLDGGASWREVPNFPANSNLNSVACCGHSDAVAVGELHEAYGFIAEIAPE